jgi:hypothetical protein
MARMQSPFTPPGRSPDGASPEHSGGAVPESHRSSLFARGTQLPPQATRVVVEVYRWGGVCQRGRRRPHDPYSFSPAASRLANLAGQKWVFRHTVAVAEDPAAEAKQAVFTALFTPRVRLQAAAKKPTSTFKPLRCSRR